MYVISSFRGFGLTEQLQMDYMQIISSLGLVKGNLAWLVGAFQSVSCLHFQVLEVNKQLSFKKMWVYFMYTRFVWRYFSAKKRIWMVAYGDIASLDLLAAHKFGKNKTSLTLFYNMSHVIISTTVGENNCTILFSMANFTL